MEKYIFVLSSVLVLLAFVNFSAVVAHPNHVQFEECKTAEKATDEDLKTMRDPNIPKSRGAKCVLTCLGEKMKQIENKKLVSDGAINWFKNSPNFTEQMQQTITEIVNACKDVTDDDRCEAGFKIMECLKDEGNKRGFKPPFKGGKGERDQRPQN